MIKRDFDVEKTALLAAIRLTEEEKVLLAEDMREIVAFAARISEAVTEEGETFSGSGPLRLDEEAPFLNSRDILKGAPSTIDSYISVVNIIE